MGVAAGAGDIACRLGDSEHRAAPRIEVAVASVAVDRHRQRTGRSLDPDDAGADTREHERVRADHVVVLAVDPALARDRSATPSSAQKATYERPWRPEASATSSVRPSSR